MPSLYERLLGRNYHELAHVLHTFHAAGSHGRARGRLAVEHGPGKAARWLARLMRLPEQTPQADVTLQVTAEDDHEVWDRTFGAQKLRTRAYAKDGLLVESMGPLRLGFELLVEDGGLKFIHKRTWLRGVPLPQWLAPHAQAQVTPAGERWKIDMRLAHPAIGLIIRYHGYMAPASPEASSTKHQISNKFE